MVGRLVVRIGRIQRRTLVRPVRIARLAVVAPVEAGAVAAAAVEIAVRPEQDRADRMAGVLLEPVLDQHLLVAGRVAVDGQARDAPADHAAAAVVGRAGRARAARRPPARRPRRRIAGREQAAVVGVLHVDVGLLGKARIERETEQAAVPEVVHLRAEVDEDLRRGVQQVAIDEDLATLLGDEDAAVVGEMDAGRLGPVRRGGCRDGSRKAEPVRMRCLPTVLPGP